MHGEYDGRIAVREGDVLLGKYRVERVLGTGGMGVVVAARHLRLDERVAIKFLSPDHLTNTEAVARFDREARAAAKIKSEHVARVTDVGTLDNGCPYMVMEYLEGEDLAERLQKRGPLASDQAVEFILQACEAMAEAHGLGIVHRDLKPANLFCITRPDGLPSIKVIDFGIAKFAGSGPDVTHANAVMGSPLYMSPEQMVSARSVDARTDIWSLGVILYELVSGRGAFRGETYPEVCMSVASQPAPQLSATVRDVPPGLDAVIVQCLQKDRKKRYANVAELAVALALFAPKRARASVDRISRVIATAGLSDSPMALPPSSNPSAAPAGPATMASWGNTDTKAVRNRAGLGIAAAIGLGVGAIAATWIVQRSAPPAAKSTLDHAAQPAETAPAVEPSASVTNVVTAPAPVAPEATLSTATSPPPPAPASSASAANEPAPAPPRATTPTPARARPVPASPRSPSVATAPVSKTPVRAAPASSRSELGGRL